MRVDHVGVKRAHSLSKETYAPVKGHNFILGYYFTCFNEQKNIRFLLLSSAAALHSPSLCFSSCLFKDPLPNTKSALIGQLTHAWPSTANSNRATVQNESLRANLAQIDIDYAKHVPWWRRMMSQRYRIKGGIIDEAFQEITKRSRSPLTLILPRV